MNNSKLAKENAALKAEIKKMHKEYSEALKSMEQNILKKSESLAEAYDIMKAIGSINEWGRRWLKDRLK